MNIPQLTPDELKTLQLFAYYCRSYGADSVYKTYYLSACDKDWEDDRWYSRDVNGGIEGYDRIDELIEKLVDDESIINHFNECDGSQRIEVEIDCKEKSLIINAYETIYGTDPYGNEYTLENIEDEYGEDAAKAVEELFTYLDGRDASVNFSGGGDDGYIEDDMTVDGEQEDIPKPIEELLYSILNGNHAGWENNEGAQGSWEFNSGNKTIFFDFNYNTEEESNIGLDYEIKF
jgi:hypothetical protein